MKSLILTCVLVALLVGATVLCAHAASASNDVGAPELKLLQDIFTGALGKFAGLLVVFIGVYTFFAKGKTEFGLILMVAGIVITLLPALYNGARAVMCPIYSGITGSQIPNC